MAYVTDMTLSPKNMLLGLINADNNLGIVESEAEVLAPVAITPDGEGRDTSVQVDLEVLPSEVEDDFVTFTYTRIDLATLFGAIAPTFREVDVPLNESGVPADADAFYAEVLRKFGVFMDTTNFTYALKSAGVITISAIATNLAYTGSFDISVESSLASRIATVVLDGFSKDSLVAA